MGSYYSTPESEPIKIEVVEDKQEQEDKQDEVNKEIFNLLHEISDKITMLASIVNQIDYNTQPCDY
jgi:hypothetical protein